MGTRILYPCIQEPGGLPHDDAQRLVTDVLNVEMRYGTGKKVKRCFNAEARAYANHRK